MSLKNLQTREELQLEVGEPIILGRHICGIEDPTISRKHVQITLRGDKRCFIKKFNEAHWLKVHDENVLGLEEIEVQDGDILEFVQHYQFQFKLPKLPKIMRRKKDWDEFKESDTESEEDAADVIKYVQVDDEPRRDSVSSESSYIRSSTENEYSD